MKVSVALMALLTLQAIAGDYSLERTLADPVEYELLNLGANGIIWKMYVQSVYDEDTGYEWLQIEHKLWADIKKTDEVQFEIAFTSKGDPWTDR